jgi:hypothetical protein
MQHSEWEQENSLTSPQDRDMHNRWKPDTSKTKLTDEEVENALEANNNTSFTERFKYYPKREKAYHDPEIVGQKYGLFSFVPSKGATPDSGGIYGMIKLRGNFGTEEGANTRAEELVRDVDSYHTIYHSYVGRPCPLTIDSRYSAHVEEVEVSDKIKETISNSIRQKRKSEEKEMQEIRNREQKLYEESKKAEEGDDDDMDPFDYYITLRVKKAQLLWTYLEHMKKMEEIKHIVVKTRKEIEDIHETNEEYKEKFLDKYIKARKEAGIKEDNPMQSFMRYLNEEVHIPEIEKLYYDTYKVEELKEE